MTRKRVVTVDTETHLIAPGVPAPKLVVAAFTDGTGPGTLEVPPQAIESFKALTRDLNVTLNNTHICYDFGVFAAADASAVDGIFNALETNRVLDTTLLEALHDNASGRMFLADNGAPMRRYSQAFLEKRYLGVDRSEAKHGVDAWRMRYAELDGMPLLAWPEEAKSYPLDDVCLAHELHKIQTSPTRENLAAFPDEMRFAWAAHLMRLWGIRTDPALVDVTLARIEAEHERSRREFFDAGIVRVRKCIKGDEPDEIDEVWLKQAFTRIFESQESWAERRRIDIEKALKALAKGKRLRFAVDTERLKELVLAAYQNDAPVTETGGVSTSRDTLIESGDELLEAYGEAGPNEKLYSTYRDVMRLGTKVPINAEINTIVDTQRTSMREPNLQQLPQKGGIRECFVPRDGWVFLSSDFVAYEMATLAQCCINLGFESEMGRAINAGKDLHILLAAEMAHVTYDEALARKAAKDPHILNLRKAAKPVNFGMGGLMGPPKMVFTARKQDVRFCELAGVTKRCADAKRVVKYGSRPIPPTCSECLKLAAQFKELWYRVFPEMKPYHQHTIAESKRGRVTSFGTGMVRGCDSANACSNHLFQNLAAQVMKRACWLLAKESYTDRSSILFNNYRQSVPVHDEIFAEVREEVAHECAQRQMAIMRQACLEFVPDVKIEIEPALMRRWFKGAAPAYAKDGRLKPWWPKDWAFEPDLQFKTQDEAA